MSFASIMTPDSVIQAATFLARPLVAIMPTPRVLNLQQVLQSTLTSAFLASRTRHIPPTLSLSLSPNIVPPLPIHSACVATDILWSEWISVLSSAAFNLIITPTAVSVHMLDGKHAIVWKDSSFSISTCHPISVPISKTALRSSLKHRTIPPPLTRKLLDPWCVDTEGDKMSPSLPQCDISVLSPIPTRGAFGIAPEPTGRVFRVPFTTASSPGPLYTPDRDFNSETDSRPSSRNSLTSAVSFTSTSNTSVSSIHSSPSPPSSCEPLEETQIFVDKTKKELTRYTYSGGVSTVLTGGVMLGPTFASNTASFPQKASKQTTRTTKPTWKSLSKLTTTGRDTDTWRRVGALIGGAGRF